jgi:uncharacterized tellurite resistance protein B-like protein
VSSYERRAGDELEARVQLLREILAVLANHTCASHRYNVITPPCRFRWFYTACVKILEWLGLKPKPALPTSDVDTVRRIGEALDKLPPERARWVGTYALLLARVAHADLNISDDESRRMEELVREHAALADAEAALVIEMAKAQHRVFGSAEGYLASREFRGMTSREERVQLLDALFAVSAADDVVTTDEEEVIRQIANELGLTHAEYVTARATVRDKRRVLKDPGRSHSE